MAYIVPSELPKSCVKCFFGYCVYSHPWVDSRNKKTGKGYRCQLDPQKRVLDMDYKDTTSKAEWCPLKELLGDDNAE